MTQKLVMVVIAVWLSPLYVHAQTSESSDSAPQETQTDYKDAWKTPYISDEMTLDPEQNASWRKGEYKFPAKPKHSWELGLHLGHFLIDGDVDRNIFGGYGAGVHLRKAMNYTVSVRASLMYGMATGMEAQPTRHRNNTGLDGVGGGLVEDIYRAYDPMLGGPGEWFAAYKTTYVSGDIAAIFNIGNLLFHRERNKWNLYFGLGLGLNTHTTMLDLLNANGLPYDALSQRVNWSLEEFDTKSGRARIKQELEAIYDGDYETEGPQKAGIFKLGDEMNVHMSVIPSVGFSRKISKRMNVSFEHSVYLSDTDYLDGVKFRTSVDQSNNLDVAHYTQVRLGINLGNFNKMTEPLYWMNPIDQAFTDIAELKKKESLDFTDEDNDGVIDLIDQELNTPEDCPVDTRGIILDSDGDGLVDCEDKEPYSPPGCPVDGMGVAQCEAVDVMDEARVRAIVDEELNERITLNASVENIIPGDTDGGSPFVERINDDGSRSTISKNDEGVLTEIVKYDSGAETHIKQYPDGNREAVFINPMGESTKLKEDSQGVIRSTRQNADGSVTSNVQYPDGKIESTTQYTDGAQRHTVKETDGTIISDYVLEDGSSTTTTKFPNGVVKSQTRNPDGSVITTTMDADNTIKKKIVDPDGVVRYAYLDNDTGDMVTEYERPDGAQVSLVQRPDGVLIEKVDFPDGSYTKTSQYSNGEVTRENLSSDGVMTNIKQRPDGSQRIVVSTDAGIASDTELNKDEATAIAVSEKSYGIFAPEIPEIDLVEYSIPTITDVPDDIVNSADSKTTSSYVNSECGDWFLPMIHFDLNRYSIKPQYFSHLHNVADVLKKCPDVCVVAQGHTDTRHSNDFNTVLSYKRAKAAVDHLTETYGIDRSRIKLMYGGEDSPMVLSANSEAHHFMNRRVEFRTCENGDADMPAPPAYKADKEQKQNEVFRKGGKASGY